MNSFLSKSKMLLIACTIGYCASSQTLFQKLLPSDKAKPSWYGDPNGRHTSMAMDDNTLIVGDAEWYSYLPSNIGCSAGYGAINIFKKSGNTWSLSQTFLHTPGTERKFGGNVSLKNNVLVVSAEREDKGATTRMGCLFVYRRNDANSNFNLLAKVYPSDGYASMDFANSSVATNGQYVVSGGKNGIQKIYVFKINGNAVDPYKIISTPGFVPNQLYVMSNNTILAVSSGKAIRMFKLEGDNYVEINDSRLTIASPYDNFTGISAFDGNTLVAEVRFSYKSTYNYYKVWKFGYNTIDNVSTISALPFKQSDPSTTAITIKENKWLFITSRRLSQPEYNIYRNQVLAFRYYNNKYFYASTVDKSDDNISSDRFARGVVTNGEVLAVADPGDLSFGTTNYNVPCDQQTHSGAVSLYDIKPEYITWGNAGSQKAVNPLADKYDYMSYDVSVSGNYALIGVGDNDFGYFNGAAMLYKKENGGWNFLRKLQHYQVTNNARMGDAVDISNTAAVIGAPLLMNGSNYYGAVFSYPINDPNYGAIENVVGSQIIMAPDPVTFDYFGFDVSVQGNNLIVSAPYKNNSKGAVYYYTWSGSYWSYKQTIVYNGLANNDNFGYSVDVNGDYLLIGAPGTNSNAGVVYLYKLVNGSFVYQSQWTPASSGGYFGRDVSIGADYAAIGSLSASTVKIYKRTNSTWATYTTLSPVSGNTNLNVALEGTKLMIGVQNEGGQAKTIRYELYGSTWTKTGTILLGASGRATRVAINGDQSLIGYNPNGYKDGYGLFTNFYNISGARVEADFQEAEETNVDALLSPNPAYGNTLKINMEEAISVEFRTIAGQLIQKVPVVAGLCAINELPKGLYIVTVQGTSAQQTQRLVVE